MKKEMNEPRNAIKEKTDWSLDRMVKAIDSPFTTTIEPFDGLKDPQDHLNPLKTTLGLQQPLDKILCHSFPTNLKEAVREWFTKLPTSSIDSFKQLSNTFLPHFGRTWNTLLGRPWK